VKRHQEREEEPFLLGMTLTGVSLNAVEDLVRQTCLKLPLDPRKPCDLSVVHPLQTAPGELEIVDGGKGEITISFPNPKGWQLSSESDPEVVALTCPLNARDHI